MRRNFAYGIMVGSVKRIGGTIHADTMEDAVREVVRRHCNRDGMKVVQKESVHRLCDDTILKQAEWEFDGRKASIYVWAPPEYFLDLATPLLGKDKPADAPALESIIPEDVEPDDVAQLYYDRPDLCRLIDATINHTLDIVATNLGVESFDAGDGSEDFWGDVGGSVANLLQEAGLEDYRKPADAPELPCPAGYRRTGERRLPKKGELYINSERRIGTAIVDWTKADGKEPDIVVRVVNANPLGPHSDDPAKWRYARAVATHDTPAFQGVPFQFSAPPAPETPAIDDSPEGLVTDLSRTPPEDEAWDVWAIEIVKERDKRIRGRIIATLLKGNIGFWSVDEIRAALDAAGL